MAIIYLTMGWFESVEVPEYDLDEYIPGWASCLTTYGYADTCVHIKSCLTTDLILNKSFTPLLKDFNIKHVPMTSTNPQGNAPVEQVRQVILNRLANKDLPNKAFDYIYKWG